MTHDTCTTHGSASDAGDRPAVAPDRLVAPVPAGCRLLAMLDPVGGRWRAPPADVAFAFPDGCEDPVATLIEHLEDQMPACGWLVQEKPGPDLAYAPSSSGAFLINKVPRDEPSDGAEPVSEAERRVVEELAGLDAYEVHRFRDCGVLVFLRHGGTCWFDPQLTLSVRGLRAQS